MPQSPTAADHHMHGVLPFMVLMDLAQEEFPDRINLAIRGQARAMADARPIPRLAPVTKATFLSSIDSSPWRWALAGV